MADHIDIWRFAGALVRRYGTEAPDVAGKRSWRFDRLGNVRGEDFWFRVLEAIGEMERRKQGRATRR